MGSGGRSGRSPKSPSGTLSFGATIMSAIHTVSLKTLA
jgi:hypothetical protein